MLFNDMFYLLNSVITQPLDEPTDIVTDDGADDTIDLTGGYSSLMSSNPIVYVVGVIIFIIGGIFFGYKNKSKKDDILKQKETAHKKDTKAVIKNVENMTKTINTLENLLKENDIATEKLTEEMQNRIDLSAELIKAQGEATKTSIKDINKRKATILDKINKLN